MALATHLLTINAAFLQEIKTDHHELRQLMHHTSAMLRRFATSPVEMERLAEQFARLRDQLAMHFSLEEAYGYFDDALKEAPRLSRRAERLRNQHPELYEAFCQLAERAENFQRHGATSRLLSRLADDYFEFSAAFQEHEKRESDLILEALDDDIGNGD